MNMGFPMLIALVLSVASGSRQDGPPKNGREPIIVGAMRDVMWNGHLAGRIDIDTISGKRHLYGLGPEEYLTGELMVIDGKCYKSEIGGNGSMEVTETFKVKAPFFGYANIAAWN